MYSQNELEKSIASIWKEILNVDSVGVRDNFFDLGGTSALMVQVNGRLRETVGLDLPILELFKFPTIASLALHLAREGAAPEAPRGADELGDSRRSRKSEMEWQRRARSVARRADSGDDER